MLLQQATTEASLSEERAAHAHAMQFERETGERWQREAETLRKHLESNVVRSNALGEEVVVSSRVRQRD